MKMTQAGRSDSADPSHFCVFMAHESIVASSHNLRKTHIEEGKPHLEIP